MRPAALTAAAFATWLIALGAFAAPASAGCKYSAGKPTEITDAQAQKAVVCLINKERRSRGRKALRVNKPLKRAARAHSRRMVALAGTDTPCFAHTCSDSGEPPLRERVTRTGYLPCGCRFKLGETIAYGHQAMATPRVIVRSWMASSDHRAVILTRGFRHIGVGAKMGSPYGNRDARTYTADFGVKRR